MIIERYFFNLIKIFILVSLIWFYPFEKATSDENNSNSISGLKIDDIFFEDFEGQRIDNSVWKIATWNEHGGQTGVDRCYVENGILNLIFINDSIEGFLSSAIESRDEFLYGKWEVRLKTSSVPGVLNSFFTIDWNDFSDNSSNSNGTKQEIDIEFLTKSFSQDSGEVHLAVHETGKTSFNTNPDINIDFNPSQDFHVWGFEITPDYIQWFVDGTILHKYVYQSITIDAPYQIKLNFWSQIGGWIGGPPEENIECVYQIDWIKFTPSNID